MLLSKTLWGSQDISTTNVERGSRRASEIIAHKVGGPQSNTVLWTPPIITGKSEMIHGVEGRRSDAQNGDWPPQPTQGGSHRERPVKHEIQIVSDENGISPTLRMQLQDEN